MEVNPKDRCVVIHSTETSPGQKLPLKSLRREIHNSGFYCPENPVSRLPWHILIRRNGEIVAGCDTLDQVGTNPLFAGLNEDCIHIALQGGVDESGKTQNNFTSRQFSALGKVLDFLIQMYGEQPVMGANQLFDVEAPGFDVNQWMIDRV